MFCKWVIQSLLMCCIIAAPALHAFEVAIITHVAGTPVLQLSEELFKKYGITNKVFLVSQQQMIPAQYKVAIVVGLPALKEWENSSIPAIGALSSRVAMNHYKEKLVTGVYWTPPISRQVSLAKAILGVEARVGILVDKRANWEKFGIDAQYMRDNQISVYFTDTHNNLTRSLQDVLQENDVLIGLFDTDLYSSANLKNILITAYRLGRPLIGPTSAYLQSGSLATTYSNNTDVAQRLNDILREYELTGKWLSMEHNPYFRVGFNPQVGRSLNLELPNAEELAARLYQQEQQAHALKNQRW